MLSLLVVLAGASAKAETWYLYTTINSGSNAYSTGTRPVVLEMDSKEGCEEAGSILKEEVKTNRIEHVKNISFVCIKRK